MPAQQTIYTRPLWCIISGVIINAALFVLIVSPLLKGVADEPWYIVAMLAAASLLTLFGLVRDLIQFIPGRRPTLLLEGNTVIIRSWARSVSFDLETIKIRFHGPNALLGSLSIEDQSKHTVMLSMDFPRELFSFLPNLVSRASA